MLWWTVILILLVILLFFSQLGILFPLQLKFTVISGIFLYILTLACLITVLLRILNKTKKREKEKLVKRIQELEQEFQSLKEKMK